MTSYDKIEFVSQTITDLLRSGGIEVMVNYEDSLSKGLVFNVSSPDSRLLIGYQGSSLYALELIVHAIVAKHFANQSEPIYFSIDINEYKLKRQWYLKQVVKDSIDKLKRTGKPVILGAMPKYERKFLHTYVQEQFPHITTDSIGDEPHRKIKLSM